MDQPRFQQQQQMSSGLTRYRSAPSSYFSSLLESSNADSSGGFARDDFDTLLNTQNSSSDVQQAFGRFMASIDSNTLGNSSVKQESDSFEQVNFPQLQSQSSGANAADSSSGSGMDSSYSLMKMNTGIGSSNLTRYNTSPAGFFDQFDIENEYGAMRGSGSCGGAGSNANAQALFSSPSRFKNHGTGPSSGDDNVKAETSRDDQNYMSSFPGLSWEDSDLLSDSFLNVSEEKPFSSSDLQKSEDQIRPPAGLLSHHLSLPKIPSQLSAIMQDSVPCKVRAKRGCATHPRSIAERVRRTRISERMRKLQELVPNMDKQTNTADMLDLAVDYIKDLESQVKVLSDNRAKCSCLSK